jgi:hypothetical protein
MPEFNLMGMPNFPNSKTFLLQKGKKPKLKYWYHTEINVCVLCGKETKTRERVYQKDKAGTVWIDDACHNHFI